jgi:arylsulfatase A-like enzyme
MTRPNFLIISIDSLRHDFCSFLNENENTMRFLDDFAEQSTVYERAISPSVWTLPVHTSIFTGLYPTEHQINDGETILGDHPTFAELLSEAGYETRSFTHNDWFRTAEMVRGFEHEHTRMPGMIDNGITNIRNGVEDRSYELVKKGITQVSEAPLVKARKAVFRHHLKGSRTVSNSISRLKESSSPFCYMVHLNDVHHAYRPHISYYREFGTEGLRTLHKNVLYQQKLKNNREAIYTGNFKIDQKRLPLMKDLYRASILQTDRLVKRLVNTLSEIDEAENTVVIVFGDHGDLIGEEESFGHSFSVADELIRVPLLVHDPSGQLKPGRRQSIAQLNDIYPTVLELAGETPPETNSISLLDDSRNAAFVHFDKTGQEWEFPRSAYPPFRQHAIWKSTDSKLVYYPDEDREAEESNSKLRPELDEHFGRLNPVPSKGEARLSEDIQQQLKSMGYL